MLGNKGTQSEGSQAPAPTSDEAPAATPAKTLQPAQVADADDGTDDLPF